MAWQELAPAFDETGQHVEATADWSTRLKDPAIETELKTMLSAAIDELPSAYRTIFHLHDVEGLSNVEIASALELKLATVKSRGRGSFCGSAWATT